MSVIFFPERIFQIVFFLSLSHIFLFLEFLLVFFSTLVLSLHVFLCEGVRSPEQELKTVVTHLHIRVLLGG